MKKREAKSEVGRAGHTEETESGAKPALAHAHTAHATMPPDPLNGLAAAPPKPQAQAEARMVRE